MRVMDRQGREVPLIFNRMHNAIDALSADDMILMAGRQIGKSLYFIAEASHGITMAEWRARVHPDLARQFNVQTLLHSDEGVEDSLRKLDLILDRKPALMRPEKETDRAGLKVFAKTKSRFLTATYKSDAPGQSFTIHRLFCDEAGHPSLTKELMKNVLPAVPPTGLGGRRRLASVPYGAGGYFYASYQNPPFGKRLFVPWWWCEDFRFGSPNDWSDILPLWPDEVEVVETEGLKADQLRWWRHTVHAADPDDPGPGGSGESIARQQYPWNDVDCWFGAVGKPFISAGIIRPHIRRAKEIVSTIGVSRGELIEEEGRTSWSISGKWAMT